MQQLAKYEYLVIGALGILALLIIIPAVFKARIAVRDDLRMQDMAILKQAVEQYNNTHDFYVTPPTTTSPCTTSMELDSWLFGSNSSLIKEGHIDALPHDVRESTDRHYVYCATDIQSGRTTGYYLEAHLEQRLEPEIGFDEDESRKFDYRILNQDDKTLYRVCGGTETQCKPQDA
ncbi:MAG: hypothetical protein WD200_03875 [Candidatus Andersenbacteria bacterium]